MRMRTITVGPTEADTLRSLGLQFVLELKEDADDPTCPAGVRADWQKIADWLEYSAGELTSTQVDQIKRGWSGYLAIGLAPCHNLQPNFDHFSKQVSGEELNRTPTIIMNVFDRLLATDQEIKQKRVADIEAERRKLEPIFEAIKRRDLSRWRSLSPAFRQWVFVCIIWFVAVYAYAYLFDPFDTGGWDNMDDDAFNRVVAVAVLPIIGGFLHRAYRKWIA